MTIPSQPKQIKSKWYYIFWGIATLSVVFGQIHVGSKYSRMADNLEFMLITKQCSGSL